MTVSRLTLLQTLLFHILGQIDFRAQNRMNSLLLRLFIEINYTIHYPVIRQGTGIHPEFLHAGYHFRNLPRAVQQTVAAMYMQMCKCHLFHHAFFCYRDFKRKDSRVFLLESPFHKRSSLAYPFYTFINKVSHFSYDTSFERKLYLYLCTISPLPKGNH